MSLTNSGQLVRASPAGLSDEVSEASSPASSDDAESPNQRGRRWTSLLGLAILLGAIALGAGGYVAFTSSSDSPSSAATEPTTSGLPAGESNATTSGTDTVTGSGGSSAVEAYVTQVNAYITESRQARAQMVSAIRSAHANTSRSAQTAATVVRERAGLVHEVEALGPPDVGFAAAQRGLVRCFQLSKVSDSAYHTWMVDLEHANTAAAKAAYARAQANDPRATAAKHAFLHAYNRLLKQHGYQPLPAAELF